jgi:hypothetical protein
MRSFLLGFFFVMWLGLAAQHQEPGYILLVIALGTIGGLVVTRVVR